VRRSCEVTPEKDRDEHLGGRRSHTGLAHDVG
jgi:hypothetical protein